MTNVLRKKSPRAPSISLDEAFARVMKIYDRERLHPAPTDVIAQHLGFKTANSGSALSTFASLRYFGLLVRPKEGALAVAREVESYKFSPDEKMRRSLLLNFLERPALYKELLEKYEAGLPSDANLKFELIQRGFAPQAAESAMIVFKKSVDFVDYYGDEENQEVEENTCYDSVNSIPESYASSEPASDTKVVNTASPSAVTQQTEADDPEIDRIPVRLSGGRRAWLLIPAPFYNADKARLKAQIDLLLTAEDEGEA
jgi:hypothetical protein